MIRKYKEIARQVHHDETSLRLKLEAKSELKLVTEWRISKVDITQLGPEPYTKPQVKNSLHMKKGRRLWRGFLAEVFEADSLLILLPNFHWRRLRTSEAAQIPLIIKELAFEWRLPNTTPSLLSVKTAFLSSGKG